MNLNEFGYNRYLIREPVSLFEQINDTGNYGVVNADPTSSSVVTINSNQAAAGIQAKSITVDKLIINKIGVNDYISSNGFTSGSLGWRIHGNGDAEFNNISVRGNVATQGNDGVVFDEDGIRGYNSVLGKVFDLPTNGDPPFFSNGSITESSFEITTNGVMRTSETVGDGSADSAGVLINNAGFYACEANQTASNANVKILADGTAVFKGAVYADSGTFVGAITATSGSFSGITAAQIDVGASGYILGGQTEYNAGVGFFLGKHNSDYKLSIGDPDGEYITWDGSYMRIKGNITLASILTMANYAVANLPNPIVEVGYNNPGGNE